MKAILAIASAGLIMAGASSAASAAHGSHHATVHGNTAHATATMVNKVHRVGVVRQKPNFRYGWGYGRGWCYWHPYACYYRAQ